MKKLLTIVAASVALAAFAADTDVGALITASNIEDVAAVENLTGANAGKATVTIKNNSGTANAVTVYNSATVDTALSGKASTGDVTALQTRATALETATNNLTTAVAAAQSTANGKVSKSGDTMSGALHFGSEDDGVTLRSGEIKLSDKDGNHVESLTLDYESITKSYDSSSWMIYVPDKSGTFALLSDILTQFPYTAITNAPWITSYTETDPTVPSWATASSKPSYNFSEIGSKPTTISGYGITDAKIANGTITLGSNSITPLTSYTESDPVFTAAKAAMDAATAAKVPLANVKINNTAITDSTVVELGQYYVKTVDGKPHLFLRGN